MSCGAEDSSESNGAGAGELHDYRFDILVVIMGCPAELATNCG